MDDIKSNQKQGYFLAQDAMPTIINNRGDFLSNATDLGIQFLNKDESGFFLMTEGSQVDWGGHDNDGEYLVSELIDFERDSSKFFNSVSMMLFVFFFITLYLKTILK